LVAILNSLSQQVQHVDLALYILKEYKNEIVSCLSIYEEALVKLIERVSNHAQLIEAQRLLQQYEQDCPVAYIGIVQSAKGSLAKREWDLPAQIRASDPVKPPSNCMKNAGITLDTEMYRSLIDTVYQTAFIRSAAIAADGSHLPNHSSTTPSGSQSTPFDRKKARLQDQLFR
jgi:hypothetical protein